MKIGIAGGGSIGSLLAWRLAKTGADVEVFDAGAAQRCGTAAAGLLSPTAELSSAEPEISKLGITSLPLWQAWLEELGSADLLVRRGSILVAHRRDAPELQRMVDVICSKLSASQTKQVVALDQDSLAALEPELAHLTHAYYFPDEGHLDTDTLLGCLRQRCHELGSWHDNVKVQQVLPGRLIINGRERHYDWACDCRGLGGSEQLQLRPVRGEIIHLDAQEVQLTRPVRLAHPRYPVYVVPRGAQGYLVGATEIESSDRSGVSVRSAIELLSAACALHTGFTEARITELRVGLRPTTTTQLPAFASEPGKVTINGMYRHGFLAGPALVERAAMTIGLH